MFYNCISNVIMYLEPYLTVFFVYLQYLNLNLFYTQLIYLTFINYFKNIEKNCKYSHKLEYL